MDSRALLSALVEGEVGFVLVGGVAAVLQGVPVDTFDVDVVHARDPENAQRLAAVLLSLEACYRDPLPKRLEPRQEDLTFPGRHRLMTHFGPLDLLGRIAGEKGYEDLIDRAPLTDLGKGLRVHVLDLEVLVEVKEATGREKDRAQLPEYRRTLGERRRRGGQEEAARPD
ncbi:MAG: hypothetical protein ACKVXR_00065 [Planctomycetota bacterium]